jgi:hypothetical protein
MEGGQAVSFCPHCNSCPDPVLKDSTWYCINNEHLKLREEYISEIERENERLKEQNKRQNEAIDSLREMYAKEAKP